MNELLHELQQRGFIDQVTDGDGLAKQLSEQSITAYVGFDPTADSLHAGHLIPLMGLYHLRRYGHRPIVLSGVGTAMIGDPSGKNQMRKMLSSTTLKANAEAVKQQIQALPCFAELANRNQDIIYTDNSIWLNELNLIEFLRDVALHFSVNRMLTFETFRLRIERNGLSFIEFCYPLLQSYDFIELYKRYGCVLQLGGNDQWANIISGVDLGRRMLNRQLYGLTLPLLTLANGAKMGKTEGGALWLDSKRVSAYDYYQYWLNIPDEDCPRLLKLLTELPLDEIARLGQLEGEEIREAKAILAFEATRFIHGEEQAALARRGASAAFGDLEDVSLIPCTTLSADSLTLNNGNHGLLVIDALLKSGLAKSKSEARRLILQGGVRINNDERIDSIEECIKEQSLASDGIILRVGKKKVHRLILGDS